LHGQVRLITVEVDGDRFVVFESDINVRLGTCDAESL
jgi:hypothetical protein